MISIVTINLNNSDGLKRTFASVMSQTNIDFEWVIVDGGSTDGSLNILDGIERINTVIISEADNGLYDAMNKGILLASRKYILFLNSGDILVSKNALSQLLVEINRYSFPSVLLMGYQYLSRSRLPRPLWWRFWSLPTSHQSIVYSRNLLVNNPFCTDYFYAADFEHFLRLSRMNVEIRRSNFVLAENELYGSDAQIFKVLKEYSIIRRKYIGGFAALILNTIKYAYTSLYFIGKTNRK